MTQIQALVLYKMHVYLLLIWSWLVKAVYFVTKLWSVVPLAMLYLKMLPFVPWVRTEILITFFVSWWTDSVQTVLTLDARKMITTNEGQWKGYCNWYKFSIKHYSEKQFQGDMTTDPPISPAKEFSKSYNYYIYFLFILPPFFCSCISLLCLMFGLPS